MGRGGRDTNSKRARKRVRRKGARFERKGNERGRKIGNLGGVSEEQSGKRKFRRSYTIV